MGKVIYIRTSDGVLLRFEDPAKVRAWISGGRLALTDVHLGADQAWHPLSELTDLSGALVQVPAASPATLPDPVTGSQLPGPGAAPVVAPGPAGGVEPAASSLPEPVPAPEAGFPMRRGDAGAVPRPTQPMRIVSSPADGIVATRSTVELPSVPAATSEAATAPLPAVTLSEAPEGPPKARDTLALPVPPARRDEAVPGGRAASVPGEAPESKAAARPREVPEAPSQGVAAAEEPMVFPADADPFGRGGEGDWWASDPVGGTARRKAVLKRAIPFVLLVGLGLGGIVVLAVLSREAEIPEIPPPVTASAPAAEAAPVPVPATPSENPPMPVPAEAPSKPVEPAVAAAPASPPIETAPRAEVPAPAPEPAKVPAPTPGPAPVPAEGVAAAALAPKAAPVIREPSTGARALPVPAPREPSGQAPGGTGGGAGDEPATYDGHMAAGTRALGSSPAVALEHFRQAAQARPGRVEPVSRMGDSAVRMGDLESAENHYRAALKIGAAYAPALVGMARVQKARGNVSDARYYYTRYLEVNPKGAQADEAQSYLERNP